jgi:hypothetical protein
MRGVIEKEEDLPSPRKKLTEDLFRSRWRSRLSLFDNLVADCTDAQEDLFRNVTTCGNMYAVCKKLENLLRSSFVTPDESPAAPGAEEGSSDHASHTDTESCTDDQKGVANVPSLPIDTASKEQAGEAGSSDDDEPIDPSSSTDVFNARMHHTPSNPRGDDDSAIKPKGDQGTFMTGISATEERKMSGAPTKKSESRNVREGTVRLSVTADVKTGTHVFASTRKPGRRESKRPAAEATADATNTAESTIAEEAAKDSPSTVAPAATKITDIFTNIAEIFPAVRLLMRHMKSGYHDPA